MMTPAHMIAVLDDAIAAAPRGRRAIALELHLDGGKLLPSLVPGGIVGKYLGTDDRGPVYGFTRRQCEDARAVIREVTARDAAAVREIIGQEARS